MPRRPSGRSSDPGHGPNGSSRRHAGDRRERVPPSVAPHSQEITADLRNRSPPSDAWRSTRRVPPDDTHRRRRRCKAPGRVSVPMSDRTWPRSRRSRRPPPPTGAGRRWTTGSALRKSGVNRCISRGRRPAQPPDNRRAPPTWPTRPRRSRYRRCTAVTGPAGDSGPPRP